MAKRKTVRKKKAHPKPTVASLSNEVTSLNKRVVVLKSLLHTLTPLKETESTSKDLAQLTTQVGRIEKKLNDALPESMVEQWKQAADRVFTDRAGEAEDIGRQIVAKEKDAIMKMDILHGKYDSIIRRLDPEPLKNHLNSLQRQINEIKAKPAEHQPVKASTIPEFFWNVILPQSINMMTGAQWYDLFAVDTGGYEETNESPSSWRDRNLDFWETPLAMQTFLSLAHEQRKADNSF